MNMDQFNCVSIATLLGKEARYIHDTPVHSVPCKEFPSCRRDYCDAATGSRDPRGAENVGDPCLLSRSDRAGRDLTSRSSAFGLDLQRNWARLKF